ncbi:MAG: glycosyltransferase family 2 protein [Crocosphaera sp.]|nr:glycosyltransferase family 2 protein [Crocosphaera sp.]
MLSQNHANTSSSLIIVIVNYRTPKLTINCLNSLIEEVQSLSRTRVVVVDNCSNDTSVEQIRDTITARGWSNWVSVIASDYNGGFAFGNNLAIRAILQSPSAPEYFLLLNPDTIVHSGAVKTLVDFMNNHSTVGIAGSRLEEKDGTPQNSAFRFHSILSELDRGLRLGIVSKLLSKWIVAPTISEVACQTDWVSGASIIIRREVFEDIGLMDEGYFMYYEEVDFCLQANKSGWTCWYVPDSKVIHLVGQSTATANTEGLPKRLPPYWFHSRQRYFLKNHGLLYAISADFVWFLSFILWKIRATIQGKSDQGPPYLLIDFVKNSIVSYRLFNVSSMNWRHSTN